MEVITADTGVALGLVLSALGFAYWLGKLQKSVSENNKHLEESEKQLNQKIDTLELHVLKLDNENRTILERLVKMETKLDIILENTKK